MANTRGDPGGTAEAAAGVLLRRGYCGATFYQAVTAPPARLTLAVTFDDALRSALTYGKPVLDRLDLVATVFAPTAFPGTQTPMAWEGIHYWGDGPHAEELIPMSWEELRSLAACGWEIGSHTVSHPHLTPILVLVGYLVLAGIWSAKPASLAASTIRSSTSPYG